VIEYRIQTAEEGVVPALETTMLSFGDEARDYDREHMGKLMPHDRVWSALDNGTRVGTAAAFPFEMTIPGGVQLPTAGVTWVGVVPTHRRRGVLTELMRNQLNDVHDRGEPIAALWASETAIYGRFGYGISAPHTTLKADKANFRFRDNPDPVGSVRFIDRDEAAKAFPAIRNQVRLRTPGMLTRSDAAWEIWHLADEEWMRRGRGPKFYVLYERDGTPEGYAVYRIKENWDDGIARGELHVQELHAVSPVAQRELWRFLFGIDLVGRINMFIADPSMPLFLLVLDTRRLQYTVGDGLWIRLVDAEAALRARSYAEDDAVVLEITDELFPANAGRYRVGTTVERTDDDPDLRLDVADLASAYLGAFTFERLADALRVEELTDGALARATAIFRTERPPYCPEIF
jgi:predicted acetyltransferase